MKKTALVTGAAGGIGFATVEKLLSAGYAVAGMIMSTPLPHKPQEDFIFVRGNIAVTEDRERFIAAAMEEFGRIDILVNVAGVAPKVRRDILEMTEESYDHVMDINTRGTFFLTQLAAKKMLLNREENKGAIVNISSLSAYTSSVSRGEYCISKAGVTMITKLFADRLAEYGIAVNEVRPGIISTQMTEKVKEKYDKMIEE
ncbi:MAG: SDR family NAD(P)-dependent oxidoreductase, partial [Clostridiales bacterium]|nr:SDR family NAD(P)-dependent oxidoreductase [Clostridiales bacterium]